MAGHADAVLALHRAGLRRGVLFAQQVRQRLLTLQHQLRQSILLHDPMQALQRSQQAGLLTRLLAAMTDAIAVTYQEIATMLEAAMLTLALQHAAQMATLLQERDALMTFDPAHATLALAAALRTTLFPSASTGAMPTASAAVWWQRQGMALTQRAQDQMRAGALAGEDAVALARRVTGTPAFRGKDGLMAQAWRSAETITEAQVAMAMTQGVEALVEANAEQVAYLECLTTRDDRTSALCVARHGKRFDPRTHAPIGHALPYLSGAPYHMHCRLAIMLVMERTV